MEKAKAYFFPLILLFSIIFGGFTGYLYPDKTIYLKPIGDIFLNLLLTAVVPLVFFSVSSAIGKMVAAKQLKKIFSSIAFTFVVTSIIASAFMICIVYLYPPAQDVHLNVMPGKMTPMNLSQHIVSIFTVKDFPELFSHANLIPLIIFSILIGLTAGMTNKNISQFLSSGSEVCQQVVMFIMYFAPVGFFAYFAVLISKLGPQLIDSYIRAFFIYYIAASIYFIAAFTIYTYLAGSKKSVMTFWKNIHLPAFTSLATCSSASSIPANIQACKRMGVNPVVYEAVVPLGAFLHKEGSILGGVLKIAFLFGIFHLPFSGLPVLLTALGVSLMVGTVMGAIPGGGLLGEMLILSFYGFPAEALLIIAAISILIDPLATMLNVTGDCACSLLVTKLINEPAQANIEVIESDNN